MQIKNVEKINKRTWYGVTATVTIGPGFIHRTGWGQLLIPHPPLANWLLRLKLTDEKRKSFSVSHEFQHLQSVPFYLIYTLVMLSIVFLKRPINFLDIIIIFVSSHAAWELLSESLAFFCNIQLYSKSYSKISVFPRLVFWISCSIVTAAGWLFIV
jgi:hypothetical protein